MLEIRAECPMCGKGIRIRPDGRFWWHKGNGSYPPLRFGSRCPGWQSRRSVG